MTSDPTNQSDAWGHLADRYEEAYGSKRESPCWPRATSLAARVHGRVLDLGCGPGFELALFERAVGLDSSPGMLRAARERAPQADLVLGDLRFLPFQPSSFNAAFSCLALIHLRRDDLVGALTGVLRILKPGSPLSATFFAGRGERDTGFSPLDPSAVAHYSFHDSAGLTSLLAAAGFEEITVEPALLNEPTHYGIACLCVAARTPAPLRDGLALRAAGACGGDD